MQNHLALSKRFYYKSIDKKYPISLMINKMQLT